jgi:hypothetical protein
MAMLCEAIISGVPAFGLPKISRFFDSRIEKFTSTGSFLGKWGSAGIGNGQFTGPESVAVDGRGNVFGGGNVFVSDFNQRVQKFACPD